MEAGDRILGLLQELKDRYYLCAQGAERLQDDEAFCTIENIAKALRLVDGGKAEEETVKKDDVKEGVAVRDGVEGKASLAEKEAREKVLLLLREKKEASSFYELHFKCNQLLSSEAMYALLSKMVDDKELARRYDGYALAEQSGVK